MATYATNPQAIHETIDGETIIIDLATGTYYSLRGAAAEIWSGLTIGDPTDTIAAGLKAVYEAEPAAIDAALSSFIGQLEEEGLIAVSPNGAGAPRMTMPAPPSTAPKQPFSPPQLERFDDMQDIILLDPVHQVDAQGWPHAAGSDVR